MVSVTQNVMRRFAIFITFLCLLIAAPSFAHEVRPAIAELVLGDDGRFSLSIETSAEALLAEIEPGLGDTDESANAPLYDELRTLPPAEIEERLTAFMPRWTEGIDLEFDGTRAGLEPAGYDIPQVGDTDLLRLSTVRFAGEIPAGSTALSWTYAEKFGSSVIRIVRPGAERAEAQFVAAGATAGPFPLAGAADRSFFEKFADYATIGFTHIIPKGLDHILFVLGLFLLSTNWRPLLWQVTAFTLAHSITLALGLYGVVNVSPAIVEPLIALSIVYVAVENIFTRTLHVWRPLVVFGFGLLHGLGFAGILTEIALPRGDFALGLVAFNIGVEFGQLAVIALAFLAVGWMGTWSWYRSRIAIPLSIGVAIMGGWWFVERTIL